jgi:hypothetical protein
MNQTTTRTGTAAPTDARTNAHGRSSEQIRDDIVRQRQELSRSVSLLRGRVGQLTDVSYQARKHRGKLIAGAAVAGLLVGGYIALRRRNG